MEQLIPCKAIRPRKQIRTWSNNKLRSFGHCPEGLFPRNTPLPDTAQSLIPLIPRDIVKTGILRTLSTMAYSLILSLVFSYLYTDAVMAQRIHGATQQSGSTGLVCVNCQVTNAANAADGNPATFSTITVAVGVAAQTFQAAIFPSTVAANTPVSLKLGTGNELLSAQVLGAINVQAYNGTDPVGSPVNAAALANAASNNDQVELTFTPASAYDRVRVTLDGGLAGVLASLYFYEAYYRGAGPVACNTVADELHGTTSALLGLGLSVGGVQNPRQAIDGDLNTASTLNAGIGLLGAYAQQTALYNTSSVVGDSIVLTLGIPETFLTVGALSNISVRTYNGNVDNNDVRNIESFTLNVSILNPDGSRRIRVAYVPNAVFDRVQLRLAGGVAAVLSSLNFYEAQRVVPVPTLLINGVAGSNTQVCSGSPATFTVAATANTVIRWYSAATGGTPIFTGNSFTTAPLTSTTTFYAEASRNGCTDGSVRAAVTATVIPAPVSPAFAATSLTVNPGATPTVSVANPQTGLTYDWYTQGTGGTPFYTGASYTTPPLSTTTVYYVDALNSGGCPSSSRTTITINVNTAPSITITPPTIAVNAGQSAAFTASSTTAGATFNWYLTPTGSSPIFTGSTFTTPGISSNTTYYAEAIDPLTGAASARATASVTVNGAPDISVNPPTATISPGQTATFTASSTTPNAVFNWYNEPVTTTPIFTGAVYSTPALTTTTRYYVQATNPATNAGSARIMAEVTVTGSPDITVTPPTANISARQSATFTATSSVPEAVFNWYQEPTGGIPVFTGSMFTTPSVSASTDYYAEAVNPSNGAASNRALARLIVVGAPDITINPVSRNINPGQSTSFTASSNTPGVIFNWYNTEETESPVFSGPTFTTPRLYTNTTFFAEAVNPSDNSTSPRASAFVTVNNLPDISISPPARTISGGQSTSFTASSSTPSASFNWYTSSDATTPVFVGSIFNTPILNTSTTFYAESVDPTTNAVSPRTAATVSVNGMPDITVNPRTRTINAGQATSFTASSPTPAATFRWYSSPAGSGQPIFTGPTFTTPALYNNTEYYVEALNGTTSASSGPVMVTVTINNTPDLTVTPLTQTISPGGTATFTASSTVPDVTVNWYTSAEGRSPVYTGSTFTTPALTGNQAYYAEAVNPATGAISDRKSASVLVTGAPNVSITPTTRNINERQRTTFSASSTTPGAVFRWYASAGEVTPLFIGPVFTTPSLSASTTYYIESADPGTGATSARISASVIVNPAPTINIVPPTQEVAAGRRASFAASSTSPGTVFNWYTSETSGNPVFTGATFTTPPISANTVYYVEGVNPLTGANSSRARAEVRIGGDEPLVFIPNAFSPNGDGNNDQLLPYGAVMSNYNLRVYNQWGQLMFVSSDYSRGWDGTWKGVDQPVGVYVYYVRGFTGDNNEIERKGTISLIR